MSDLYDHDRDHELRDALWHASGEDCDTSDAFVRVEARVRRIRRRRMDIAGLSLLVALVVALGVAWQARDHDAAQRPASEVTTTTLPPTSVGATTVASTAAPATAAPATAADPAPADSTAPGPAPDPAAPEMAPEETAPASDAPGATTGDPPPVVAAPPATPAGTRAARSEQTFSVTGGRLTVRLDDRGLSFVSASARTGYAAGTPAVSATSVAVDFTSRRGTFRIQVDLVNGHLVPTTSYDDGSHDRRPGRTSTTTATSAASPTLTAPIPTDPTPAAPTPTSAPSNGTSGSGSGGSTGGTHWGDRSGRG
jgi:hypothetical protein